MAVGPAQGWEGYRLRREALAVAAAAAVSGPVCDIQVALERSGCGETFRDTVQLAAAALSDWWLRFLGRLDASLEDDLGWMSASARHAAVQRAWATQTQEMPGYLALADLGRADPDNRSERLRYARLLALFAGIADVADSDDDASEAGLRLVAELSCAHDARPPAVLGGPAHRRLSSFVAHVRSKRTTSRV